ncbi:MAG: tRNA (adenosine(37)-N6)-threonylcarbamoyltransferase complex transferase subunit TsaD [Chloroflexota bacterium]
MARILGIETSCDETAVAVVEDGRVVRSNIIATQTDMHATFGGVVPEIASRAHLEAMVPVIESALRTAQTDWSGVDAIAVTRGPGLAGALFIGVNAAKALSFARRLPLIAVNHLEGHVYANWLVDQPEPEFPLVCLIVSGGHSDLVLMHGHGQYVRLGRTRDDAAGEAFDKAARMLGLGFPGGPLIQRAAEGGNKERFPIPRAWLRDTYDFSFSGVKTALLRIVEQQSADIPVGDLAAAFQESLVDVLATKTIAAAREHGARQIAMAGGVAANGPLRERIQQLSPVPVLIPPISLCTDNGAMIAAAAHFHYEAGDLAPLSFDATPNWPIDRVVSWSPHLGA